ncbi:MAG TPA: hypothetical protein VG713_15870 [Pirellulales bacterium]|nr:hypothetical protein [Pirellulales bacterium]
MKLETPKCPKCGQPATNIIETVEGSCGLTIDSDGTAHYDGLGMKLDWDTATPFSRSPIPHFCADGNTEVTLYCAACCHSWESDTDGEHADDAPCVEGGAV